MARPAPDRDPKERFSNRVADYVRARPGYPEDVVLVLDEKCNLGPDSAVADIGSGTGIFSELLLSQSGTVFAVEPNEAMRAAAEARLAAARGFVSITGTAEATGLADAIVDLVTAAQAFHWFDAERARREWRRVLRPPRWVALIWNERLTDETPFTHDYERLLHAYGTDYHAVDHRQVSEPEFRAFFGALGYERLTFPNHQSLDRDGLAARLRSSSYTPEPGDPRFEPMMAALDNLFRQHQADGWVVMPYETQLYVGQLD